MRKVFKEAILSYCKSHIGSFWQGEGKIKKGASGRICEIWKSHSPGLHFFASYSAHPSLDSFGVAIGWNETKVIPSVDFSDPNYFDYNNTAFSRSSYIISLSLVTKGNDIPWNAFSLEEIASNPLIFATEIPQNEAENIIHPLVEDSINLLSNLGTDYLNRKLKEIN